MARERLALPKRVIIIGGGFSGLAAAASLSAQGHEVVVLERRPFLGGRAYSFTDSVTGDTVDNGQHLFMACYHATIRFLDMIGSGNGIRFQNRLRVEFLDAGGRLSGFATAGLPAPFNVIAGFARYDTLTLRDKLSALRAGITLRGGAADSRRDTVEAWLDQLRQPQSLRQRFWHPLAIATLNENPSVASASMLRAVLKTAFAGNGRGAAIGISRLGLSDLYARPAQDFIEKRNGRIYVRTSVRKLIVEGRTVASAELDTGDRLDGDYYISAVPPNALLKLAPSLLRSSDFSNLSSLRPSPIISINLWFDVPIVDRPFLGLLGTNCQWLFDKDAIIEPRRDSNQVALVISAAREFIDMSSSQLVEMALADLHRLCPESRRARLLHRRVIKERDATISHTVDSDFQRPGTRTSLSNLMLAGDWINTGLPATIESAVISGEAAAQAIHAEDSP